MQIADLQAKQGKVDIELVIESKEEPKEFQKFGMTGKLCNCMAKDSSGQIKLTLWNEQVEKVKAGDTVKITNGYVSEYKGELQLSTGKFGELEVVGGEGAAEEKVE